MAESNILAEVWPGVKLAFLFESVVVGGLKVGWEKAGSVDWGVVETGDEIGCVKLGSLN